MKLVSAMLGIMALLLFWMTAAFLRPIPTDSYEHYRVANMPQHDTTVQNDSTAPAVQ